MQDAAEISERLYRHWVPLSTIRLIEKQISDNKPLRYIKLNAFLHDIGKLIYGFQKRILLYLPEIKYCIEKQIDFTQKTNNNKISHSLASQNILKLFEFPFSASVIVGAHHGEPQVDSRCWDLKLNPKSYYGEHKETFTDVWKKWIDYSLYKCGYESVEEIPEITQPAQMIISGLISEADWIASNKNYFPLISTDCVNSFGNYPTGRADEGWKKFSAPAPWSMHTYFADKETFEKRFSGYKPNSIQETLIETANNNGCDGGIYILEAPMGSGKTEAALMAAEILASKNQSGGIFFCLPTQATANGVFERIIPWAKTLPEEEKNSIMLAHQASELNDIFREIKNKKKADEQENISRPDNLYVHEWFNGKKQTLLSNFVVGTIDQLLLAGLSQKYVTMRHLGLAGKVVIIDEVHSYDAYMNSILDDVLRWLGSYHTPVILLSATLPKKRRAELIKAYIGETKFEDTRKQNWEKENAYPLITYCDDFSDNPVPVAVPITFNQAKRKVKIKRITEEDIISILREKLREGGCAGIICNTIKKAQRISLLIEKNINDAEILVCHSKYPSEDRSEIEKQLLETVGKNSNKKDRYSKIHIIVGTQTLEQSLDLDFDFLITDLCPMDVLLQRIGRLFRHLRERNSVFTEAICAVLDYSDEYSKIYDAWTVKQAEKYLPAEITLPDDISNLIQSAYDTETCEKNKLLEKYLDSKKVMKTKGEAICLKAPSNIKGDTIAGMLTRRNVPDNDDVAVAKVRLGVDSIPVYVMIYDGSDKIKFISNRHNPISRFHTPSEEEIICIKRQRINLPYSLSVGRTSEMVLNEIEKMNLKILPEWQKSKDFKGELVLLLDENMEVTFGEYKLKYHNRYGMITEKMS